MVSRMYPECLSNFTIGGCPVKRPELSQDKEESLPLEVHPFGWGGGGIGRNMLGAVFNGTLKN